MTTLTITPNERDCFGNNSLEMKEMNLKQVGKIRDSKARRNEGDQGLRDRSATCQSPVLSRKERVMICIDVLVEFMKEPQRF